MKLDLDIDSKVSINKKTSKRELLEGEISKVDDFVKKTKKFINKNEQHLNSGEETDSDDIAQGWVR